MSSILPSRHQRALPLEKLILEEAPGAEAIEMDVLFVGAGPAGLAGAIELARLAKADQEAGGGLGELNIGVLEKAAGPRRAQPLRCRRQPTGLPGTVSRPDRRRLSLSPARGQGGGLFPDRERIPPDSDAAHDAQHRQLFRLDFGNGPLAGRPRPRSWASTSSPVSRSNRCWSRARRCAASARRRADSTGMARAGSDYVEPTDLTARVTVLSEGTRGALSQAWCEWQGVTSANPQIFALGVKEVWKVARPLDRVIHTMGWPLPTDAFGGSLVLSAGPRPGVDRSGGGSRLRERQPRRASLLQRMKLHPLFRGDPRRRRAGRVGRQDDSRGRLPRPPRPGAPATGWSSSATPPDSSMCRRSRGCTTPCNRGSTPHAPFSPRSRRATPLPPPSPNPTVWSRRATSATISTRRATCASPSRMASSLVRPRRA